MVQPKTPPISLRIPSSLLEAVDGWAALHGCKRHAALVRLIGLGVGGDAGMMTAYFAEKQADVAAPKGVEPTRAKSAPAKPAIHVSAPVFDGGQRKAYQKGQKR